jgi:branched-chain amino acid transport system substrate-binding protein
MTYRLGRRLLASGLLFALVGAFATLPARSAEPYEIDAILSLTGNLAFVGSAEALSLKTLEPVINAQGGINGRPVHFVVADDQSNAAVAVQLANGILAKHPAVMLGPTYSASCLAIAPLIRANDGPVQYCFAPTVHPAAGGYIFSGGASSTDYAVESLVFAKAMGWKRLAIVATTDSGGQDIEAQFTYLLSEPRFSSMTVVAREHYAIPDVSVAAQLAKVKAANPDAILALTVGTPTGTLLRGLGDAGLEDTPVMSNNGNLLRAQLAQYAPIMPKAIYFAAPRFYAREVSRAGPVHDAQVTFYDAFAKTGIDDPDVGNSFAWDPVLIIVEGLRQLGPSADAKSLLAYLESVHSYAGANGIYDYRGGNQRGQSLSDTIIVRWDAAKKRVVPASEYGGVPLPGVRAAAGR